MNEGALVGFRRLMMAPPGVMLPIFCDLSNVDTMLSYQKVGEKGEVISFIGDPDLAPANIVEYSKSDVLIVKLKDAALYAYELSFDEIVVAEVAQLKNILRSALKEGRFNQFPFSALEVARFTDVSELETAYAMTCFKTLSLQSNRLAVSWAAGVSLSRSARVFLFDEMKLSLREIESSNEEDGLEVVPPPPKPRRGRIPRDQMMRIGAQLQTLYAPAMDARMPAKMQRLLKKIPGEVASSPPDDIKSVRFDRRVARMAKRFIEWRRRVSRPSRARWSNSD